MTVFKKLQKARLSLVQSNLKKSGKNAFAKYEYFELGDFIPTIHKIFDEVGLCGVFTFGETQAFLIIHDTEKEGATITFATPLVMANNPKGQAIQDLGSTHTYLRRYLWLMAMEIVEHDTVDAITDPQEQARLNEVRKQIKVEPNFKPDESRVLFVDGLIDYGSKCTRLSDIVSLWKSNQSQVDDLKKNHKAEYARLQAEFAKLKENFKED